MRLTPHLLARVLSAMLLLAAAAGAVPAPVGDARSCRRTCAGQQHACLRIARTQAAALRSACTGDRATIRSCRKRARTARRDARAGCRRLRAECVACCRAGSGPTCPIGRPVAFAPPPAPDLDALGVPRLPDGTFFVVAIPNASLAIDPTLRTPVTALGACTGWITGCVETASGSLDDCARSAPSCATDEPADEAACCPASCFDAYQAARRGGLADLAAFSAVYFRDGSCVPGLRALVEGR
jgi:hypothetical protein